MADHQTQSYGYSAFERARRFSASFWKFSSPSILQSLLGALDFQGVLSLIPAVCRNNDAHSWILDFPVTPMPQRRGGIQSAVLEILKEGYSAVDLPLLLAQKAGVTVGHEYVRSIDLQINWFHDLQAVFQQCGLFLRMCWLKAIAGAWTTTSRMHQDIVWPCIFGCTDARDEVRHYFICPVVWQIARETLNLQEDSISIGERLCLINPSVSKLKLLAFCHTLYHSCKNDRECVQSNGEIQSPLIVQNRASDIARFVKHLV